MVRLHLHLGFKVGSSQAAGHLDHLGDRCITADRHCDLGASRAGALDCTTNRLADRLGIDDGFLVDGVLRGGLGRIGFHAVLTPRHRDLNELHRGGRDIEPQEAAGTYAGIGTNLSFLFSRLRSKAPTPG